MTICGGGGSSAVDVPSLRSVRARGRPERGRKLELEAKIRDKENWCQEQMISTFAAAYQENIPTQPSLPFLP